MNNALTRFSTALILMVSWIVAWHQLLYSEHLPGDGFTAAVLLLIALMLEFVVLGYDEAARRLPVRVFYRLAVAGLVLLLLLMVLPLVFGRPLLFGAHVALFGYEASSGLVFDLAVFLIVTGVVVVSLTSFQEAR